MNFGVSHFQSVSCGAGLLEPWALQHRAALSLLQNFFLFIMNSNVAMFLQVLELLKILLFEIISYMNNIIESAICYSLVFLHVVLDLS